MKNIVFKSKRSNINEGLFGLGGHWNNSDPEKNFEKSKNDLVNFKSGLINKVISADSFDEDSCSVRYKTLDNAKTIVKYDYMRDRNANVSKSDGKPISTLMCSFEIHKDRGIPKSVKICTCVFYYRIDKNGKKNVFREWNIDEVKMRQYAKSLPEECRNFKKLCEDISSMIREDLRFDTKKEYNVKEIPNEAKLIEKAYDKNVAKCAHLLKTEFGTIFLLRNSDYWRMQKGIEKSIGIELFTIIYNISDNAKAIGVTGKNTALYMSEKKAAVIYYSHMNLDGENIINV